LLQKVNVLYTRAYVVFRRSCFDVSQFMIYATAPLPQQLVRARSRQSDYQVNTGHSVFVICLHPQLSLGACKEHIVRVTSWQDRPIRSTHGMQCVPQWYSWNWL